MQNSNTDDDLNAQRENQSLSNEREKALREILEVISASRDEEKPVFDAILANAVRLCETQHATLFLVTDDRSRIEQVATRDWSPKLTDIWQREPRKLDDTESSFYQVVTTKRPVHIHDLRDTPRYQNQTSDIRRIAVDSENMRTLLHVPLMLEDNCIGVLMVYRREVRPFSDDHINLLETFAAQAVIAIENVRQFREVQTRLEREQATSQALSVISRSRDDEAPVFDIIIENASRLSNSYMGTLFLISDDGTQFEAKAWRNTADQNVIDFLLANPTSVTDEKSSFVKAITTRAPVHILDARDTERYRNTDGIRRRAVDDMNVRTMLQVPLFSGSHPLGLLSIYREEVRAFTADEIAMVETFAAQAVIAIENARQFREVQERLSREAATSEVLKVISQSRSDTQPVFHMILKKALALCDARLASMWLVSEDGRSLSMDVESSIEIEKEAHPGDNSLKRSMEDDASSLVRTIKTGKIDHDLDILSHERYRDPSHPDHDWYTRNGIRTSLIVPLSAGEHQVGCILIYRNEVRAFTRDQIELVKSFAAQAVIAIENARQFHALETLNAELSDRVEAQVSEIERMGKLKRFLPSAVADAVVSSGSEKMLSSHRALLGVLFCDIRGFTAFCETAEPEETIEVLQTYHEEMGKLINDHAAGVDHRMGDGIMVLFNDPLPCEDPAGAAMKLAIAMRARMSDLCRAWKRMGYRLGFGVGVSLGYATVGMVGFEGRSDYTASGTAINLASRLCDEAEDGEILLSTRAAIAVEDMFPSVSAGEVSLKGIREPVEVFRLDSAEEVAQRLV